MHDLDFLEMAVAEARQGLAEGGIPIGSVLVIDGKVAGRGHNRRQQNGSAVLHAEMDALEQAGRLSAAQYRKATLYTTLSPCAMCSGAVLLYRIPRVVIGENRSFMGEEALLRSRGVELVVLDHAGCRELMERFVAEHPDLWAEDIGEEGQVEPTSQPLPFGESLGKDVSDRSAYPSTDCPCKQRQYQHQTGIPLYGSYQHAIRR